MSRQNKNRNKRKHRIKHAQLVGSKVVATGSKGGRTKKLHTKVQQYPKTVLLGKWQWRYVDRRTDR